MEESWILAPFSAAEQAAMQRTSLILSTLG